MENRLLNKIMINTNIFENGSIGGISNTEKINGLDSAYNIWEEANNTILNSNGNKEILNQGFLSLKRAFNVTSMELRKNLGIDKIKYTSKKKNKDFLADLEYFEISKTLTLNKYLNIRNLIEHENYLPPSVEDCLSLSEYIWNYIRNTANIFNQFIDYIIFYDNNDNNKIMFEYMIEEKDKIYLPHLYLTAFVKSHLISFINDDDSIIVENIKLLNKFELNKKIEFEKEINFMDNLNHVAFEGEILDQDAIATYLKYLILPEYGGLDERTIQSIFREV